MTYEKRNILINIKQIFTICMLIFVNAVPVFSQIESQISQYMFHQATFNPASIGENNMISVAGQHRMQWLGVPGAPQTTFFSVNAPFKIGKNIHGVGINFVNDKAGAFTNQSANVQYAFKKTIGQGTWSIGGGVGFVGIGFVADSAKNSVSSKYHKNIDNRIPEQDEQGMGLDVSVGLFYSTPKYYAGISYAHLNSPSFLLGDKTTFHTRGIAYFTGGFDVSFENPKFMLKSSSLVKSDFASLQFDVSSRLEYDKRFWGGLSYRLQDAVVIFVGLNIMNGLAVGYAYDLPTGKMLTVSSGSHELLLKYSFAFDTSKNKNKYKSIRIL